ncbi:MAG: class I SAM-dependent methyltransferase [Terracidiphilus sp.]|jgi:SAM-dependent methyltransferase
MNQHLYDKYYRKPGFRGGTLPFLDLCTASIPRGAEILEIGAGAKNEITQMLSTLGTVTALDVDPDVLNNCDAARSMLFDGVAFPIPDESFDACVSNWVLEHVADPVSHFREVARILRPGGVYLFRTPNLYHYVMLGSRLMPHSFHLVLANRLRRMSSDAHAPWPTYYRANRPGRLKQLSLEAGLCPESLTMIEPEPAYGRAHVALFYPMMAYERIVNSTRLLETFRVIIIGITRKP